MDSPIIIVGGGWAALAAAIELTRQGIAVTVLESAKECGGRARRVRYRNMPFDNGQHLLIGAYHETLRLLKICGIDPEQAFQRAPLNFTFYGNGKAQRSIRLPRLPAPLHMVSGILQARGMSWPTRLQLISASLRFMLKGFKLKSDCSVDELLQQAKQDSATIKALWEPLCIATLNTPTHLASATIFLKVLQESFTRSHRDSDTLIPKSDLSTLFVDPAIRYIRTHGGEVHTSTRVESIQFNQHDPHDPHGRHVVKARNMILEASHIILATPPPQTIRLLGAEPQFQSISERLQQLQYQPIMTLYLQYGETARLPHPFVGFDDSLVQWLFDRSHSGEPGVMAAVISSSGIHEHWSREQIIDRAKAEISARFPELGNPKERWLIQEKRATFAATVGCNRLRPANQTTLNGVWLAGDYTATGYPATLEGALISGVESARGILENR